jgi:hypothetical protein
MAAQGLPGGRGTDLIALEQNAFRLRPDAEHVCRFALLVFIGGAFKPTQHSCFRL